MGHLSGRMLETIINNLFYRGDDKYFPDNWFAVVAAATGGERIRAIPREKKNDWALGRMHRRQTLKSNKLVILKNHCILIYLGHLARLALVATLNFYWSNHPYHGLEWHVLCVRYRMSDKSLQTALSFQNRKIMIYLCCARETRLLIDWMFYMVGEIGN